MTPTEARQSMLDKGHTLREYGPGEYYGHHYRLLVVDDGHALGGRIFTAHGVGATAGKDDCTFDDLAVSAAKWIAGDEAAT